MNQEAAILHQLEVHRDGRGGPCGCLGSKTSQGQVLQRAWSNGLVLKCDFCLGFTPALIYSELEVALGHQVATKWRLPVSSREQEFGEAKRLLKTPKLLRSQLPSSF